MSSSDEEDYEGGKYSSKLTARKKKSPSPKRTPFKSPFKSQKKVQTCTCCDNQLLTNQIVTELDCGHVYHTHCAKAMIIGERSCKNCDLELEVCEICGDYLMQNQIVTELDCKHVYHNNCIKDHIVLRGKGCP